MDTIGKQIKPIYLPYSAMTKYTTCKRMYFLHYRERLRPVGSPSVLLFGTALDSAAEEYLINRNTLAAKQKFRDMWNQQEQDGKTIEICNSTEIIYSAQDLDSELIPQSDHDTILKDTPFETISDLVKDGSEKERIAYAYWLSLYYKGSLMLKAFMDWVDHNVEEVLGTQLDIDLEDGEGNKIPGKADFVVKIYGYDKPILIDLKSSIRYYDRNSVKESEQLSLYFFYLQQTKFPDMERAAYLVLNKQIKKNRTKTCLKCGNVTKGREQTCAEGGKGKNRCNGDFKIDIDPECTVQYIHDEIPKEFIEATIEKFNISVAGIKAENFEPCWAACDNFYGRKCPFWRYCHEGESMEGLFKKERKVE